MAMTTGNSVIGRWLGRVGDGESETERGNGDGWMDGWRRRTTASALCVDVVRVQGGKLCCFPHRTPILHAGDVEN